MSTPLTISSRTAATALMVGSGLGGMALAATATTKLVGDRYLDQFLADPKEVLSFQDALILERKQRARGDSASLLAVAGGLIVGGIGGVALFRGGSTAAHATDGVRQLAAALGGSAMLGAGAGIASGGLTARQYFQGAQLRPAPTQ